MSKIEFSLPDAVIGGRAQVAALAQNQSISNQLLTSAAPKVPSSNSKLTKAQITLILTAIDKNFEHARSAAQKWQGADGGKGVQELLIDVFTRFVSFSKHMEVEYKALVERAYAKDDGGVKDHLGRIAGVLDEINSGVSGTLTQLESYQTDLRTQLEAFSHEYSAIVAQVGAVATTIEQLNSEVGALRDNVAANNTEVLNTYLDVAGTEIEQGVAAFSNAATEDIGGFSASVAQMGIAAVKGGVKVIELNEASLASLRKVRELSLEIGEDEVILAALVNIGALLISLSGTQGIKLDIVPAILGYWTDLESSIRQVLRNPPKDLYTVVDTINFNPATEPDENPDLPPWNVILPIKTTARAFENVMALGMKVFSDSTQFGQLGS